MRQGALFPLMTIMLAATAAPAAAQGGFVFDTPEADAPGTPDPSETAPDAAPEPAAPPLDGFTFGGGDTHSERRLWAAAQRSGSAEAFRAYLDAHPGGAHAAEAGEGLVAALREELAAVDRALDAAAAQVTALTARRDALQARLAQAAGDGASSDDTEGDTTGANRP